jgi:hypothetical protein
MESGLLICIFTLYSPQNLGPVLHAQVTATAKDLTELVENITFIERKRRNRKSQQNNWINCTTLAQRSNLHKTDAEMPALNLISLNVCGSFTNKMAYRPGFP